MANQRNIIQPESGNPTECHDPHPALRDLFTYYSLPDVRQQLWELLKAAVTGTEHQQPGERAGMLHFYEKLEKAMDAVHALYTQNDAGTKKKPVRTRRQRPGKAKCINQVVYRFSKN
jgi:hypothetical protein